MKILMVWNKDRICFFGGSTTDNLKLMYCFQGLKSIEETITDVLISKKHKYFIIGTLFGSIEVYKFSDATNADLIH